jgi:hypothetical protein
MVDYVVETLMTIANYGTKLQEYAMDILELNGL